MSTTLQSPTILHHNFTNSLLHLKTPDTSMLLGDHISPRLHPLYSLTATFTAVTLSYPLKVPRCSRSLIGTNRDGSPPIGSSARHAGASMIPMDGTCLSGISAVFWSRARTTSTMPGTISLRDSEFEAGSRTVFPPRLRLTGYHCGFAPLALHCHRIAPHDMAKYLDWITKEQEPRHFSNSMSGSRRVRMKRDDIR